jgi:hypothetical protein
MSSVITLAISVGVGGRPALAPQTGEIEIITHVVRQTTFVDAINAVSVVVLAYAGTPNFLNIVGEMRNPKGMSAIEEWSVTTTADNQTTPRVSSLVKHSSPLSTSSLDVSSTTLLANISLRLPWDRQVF